MAAAAFRLAGLFIVWAAGWAAVVAVSGGSWWGPLHAFMAGGVLLAISGATQLFTVTGAAAAPADRREAAAQRWVVSAGAASAVVGVTAGAGWLAVVGAVLVGVGLVGLGWILVGVVRRSLLRRFDLATRFYLLAIASGVAGVTLGGVLGAEAAGATYLDVRTTHMHLNLVGLVGFTILGTLPMILPTTMRHRMVSGPEAVAAWWGCVGAAVLMASGVVLGPVPVGVGSAVAGLAGVVLIGGIVGRLGVREVAVAGLPARLITTGTVWVLAWVGHQAVVLIGGAHTVYGRWVAVGVAGVAMVLFGSLAYLVPVLAAGGGDAVTANFARMQGWGTARVAVANLVPVSVVVGSTAFVPLGLGGLFVADYAVGVGRVLWARHRAAAH